MSFEARILEDEILGRILYAPVSAQLLVPWLDPILDGCKESLGLASIDAFRDQLRVRVLRCYVFHLRLLDNPEWTIAEFDRTIWNESVPPRIVRDVVLAEACLWRDSQARERLYSSCVAAFSPFTRMGPSDRQDICHDLFLELVEGRSSRSEPAECKPRLAGYWGLAPLSSWLKPVVRHYIEDQRRVSHVRRIAEQWSARLEVNRGPMREVTWDSQIEVLEVLSRCGLSAFKSLDASLREVLFLCTCHHWSNDVIANALQRSAGSISRLRRRALQRWAAALSRELANRVDEADSQYELLTIDFVSEDVARLLISGALSIAQEYEGLSMAASRHGGRISRRQVTAGDASPIPDHDPSSSGGEPEISLPAALTCVRPSDTISERAVIDTSQDTNLFGILCVDARGVSKTVVQGWIGAFCIDLAQHKLDRFDRPPIFVVVYDPMVSSFEPADFDESIDIRLIKTRDNQRKADEIYLESLRAEYMTLFGDGTEPFLQEESSETRPLSLTGPDSDEWNAFMRVYLESDEDRS